MIYDIVGSKSIRVAWWSAGITSAVACKLALDMYDDVELFYIHINSAHKDNERFKQECEAWYNKKIHVLKSEEYADQFEVIEKTGAVNTPYGAPCTKNLKKDVRYALESKFQINLFNSSRIINQVFGYEYDLSQINRAIRFGQQYPDTNPLFPLIEKGINKDQAAGILINEGIELPIMYKLGFTNNNCIGCVKGGKGYWNLIRTHFPNEFNRMAKLERKVGYSCINGVFLDELPIKAGRLNKEVIPNCGITCELELADLPDKSLDDVIEGKKTIYEAIAS